MLNQIFMGIYSLNKRHQEKTRDATMKVCAACEQEQVKSVQFCGKCGGNTFLSVPEFLELQGKRREAAIDDLSQRRIRSQAILAIRNIEAAPYCSSCDVYFRPEEGAKHCTRCGAKTYAMRGWLCSQFFNTCSLSFLLLCLRISF